MNAVCPSCDISFDPKPRLYGPARRFCDTKCRNKWNNDRRGPRPIPRVALYRARALREIPLGDREREIIIGTLLGDGSITLTKQRRGMLNVSHTTKQEAYFYWKLANMPRLFFPDHRIQRVDRVKRGTMTHSLYTYSIVRDELTDLRQRFYPNGRRIVPPDIADDLTPLAMAVWHMDDGYMAMRGRSFHFILATNTFTLPEIDRLIDALREYGVEAHPRKCGTPGQHVLYIGRRENAGRFAEIIRPYVLPAMQYKLPPTSLPC